MDIDWREYRTVYYLLKFVAGLITLWGAVLVADWYIPGEYTDVRVTETFADRSSGKPPEYFMVAGGDTISIQDETFMLVRTGTVLTSERSKILGKYKWMEVWVPAMGGDVRVKLENIFILNGFFAKFLLTSIFTLVFLNPTYWMIALTGFNLMILLAFSGLPMAGVFGAVFALAIVGFSYYLYRQSKR